MGNPDQLYRAYETEVKTDESAVAATFTSALAGKDLSSEWRVADGYADEVLAELAHGADLVIVGQRESEPASGTPSDLAERLALSRSIRNTSSTKRR